MLPEVVDGDLLDQPVDVIVNSWNRNIIPWWLLLPQGVSAAIKRRGGGAPFVELGRVGPMRLGSAVLTGAGRLPFQVIIHVAGINMFWLATKRSIAGSVVSAMRIVNERGFGSVAFPIIGSGSGSRSRETAMQIMLGAFEPLVSEAKTVIVRYQPCHCV